MAESSGDTPSTNPPSQSGAPEGAAPGNNLARAPRAKPPNVNTPKDAPPAGAPAGMTEFLAWMQAMGGGSPTEEEAVRPGRGVLPKEQKKFSRKPVELVKPPSSGSTDPVVAGPEQTPDSVAGSTLEAEKSTAPAPISVPPDFLNVERKRRSKETSTASPGLKLLTQFSVFALLVGSFFVGRATVPKAAPVTVAAPGAPIESKDGSPAGLLSADLLAKVDDALAAESADDNGRATEILQSVKDAGGQVVGLDYHLALLAYASGDLPRVLPLVNLSISKGEEVAACYTLRGTLANRQGGPQKGLNDLELASKLDPFNARYAFFFGEALRRSGKPQAALVALRQAIHRLREPTLESIYLLKMRLAQIELGQDGEFAPDMAANLARTPAPVDWVLTAAAVQLHRGNIPAAAGYLDTAKGLVSEPELMMRLRDFYFYSFSNEKELARFFAPMKAPAPPPAQPAVTPVGEKGLPVPVFSTPSSPLLDAPSPVTLLKKHE